MSPSWPKVSLSDVLKEVSRPEIVKQDKKYRVLGMRWYSKGLFIKNEITGIDIKAKYVYRVEENDFLYNRLFAWKGSFGIAHMEFARCYVSNEFPCFTAIPARLLPSFLQWYVSQQSFWEEVHSLSVGSSRQSRLRLKEDRFLSIKIPLPSLNEQHIIVNRIEQLFRKINESTKLTTNTEQLWEDVLFSLADELSKDMPRLPLKKVAPIIRRKVEIRKDTEYPELGIRSFGKGTFHKPAIKGSELGSKRLYRIEPGDLLFSNVFAWEGAIAVVRREDKNRFGSHRFITCLPDTTKALPEYLRTWFLSPEGIAEIRAASPGAAGRNKTLNLKKLEAIQVPIPNIERQRRFAEVYSRVQAARKLNTQTAAELNTLMPAVLDRAFRGEL